jgi:hypothetical protein
MGGVRRSSRSKPKPITTLHMTPQAAFHAFEDAKYELKVARDAYKDAQASDSTLADLAEAKKQAAADYKAEKEQFDGRNAALVEVIAEKKSAQDDAKTLFDETVEMAVRRGEQLQLFTRSGKEVSIHLTTKITIEKDVKKEEEQPAKDAE